MKKRKEKVAMRIISAGYQVIDEPSLTKKIERIARVCYKSEELIGEGTDLKMINKLIERNHTAMLEHGSIVLVVDERTYGLINNIIDMEKTYLYTDVDGIKKEGERNYLRFTRFLVPVEDEQEENVVNLKTERCIISGNMRAWIDSIAIFKRRNCLVPSMTEALVEAAGGMLDYIKDSGNVDTCYNFDDTDTFARIITDFSELSDQERMIHEDISVLFTVDRGVTHELVRMRDCSFAQESTRYCNYSNDKFGEEITVIEPLFFAKAGNPDLPTAKWSERYGAWHNACLKAEEAYFRLLEDGAPAQQARDVLPISVKADIVMTTNLREWKHIFNLRACDSTGPAHPQMKEVMIPLFKELRPQYEFAFGDMLAADEVHA